jgi:hypothetical protein
VSRRERLFVAERIKDPTASGAEIAIRAGYSAKTASVTASKFLKNPKIRDAIERGMQRIEEKAILSRAYIEGVVRNMLSVDTRKLVGPDGKAIRLADLPEEIARAVSFVRGPKGITYSLNRERIAELAAKISGATAEGAAGGQPFDMEAADGIEVEYLERFIVERAARIVALGKRKGAGGAGPGVGEGAGDAGGVHRERGVPGEQPQ